MSEGPSERDAARAAARGATAHATGAPGARTPAAEGSEAYAPAGPGTQARSHLDALYEGTLDCVHCGLCLDACPTYRETGREISSPRGRVYLMRAAAEGRMPLGEVMAEEMYLCLGCRACETACPSGVRYGALVEEARAAVDAAGLREGTPKRLERLALRGVVARPGRLRALVGALGLVQRAGLDRLARRLLPRRLREMHALLPRIPPRRARRRLPERTSAEGARRGRALLLEGCVMPELFGPVNAAAARLLAHAGLEVGAPRGQGCCGALHAHSGDARFAEGLARRNLRAFDAEEADYVVSTSAGCGAALRDYGRWLPGEGEGLAGRARDVCELLDALGLPEPRRRLELRVCYDDPCHLLHGQGVKEAPRRLLARVPGLELVPHEDASECCGAAGIYNVTHPAMSRAVLARKLDALERADPDVIATGNPGCLMQLAAGVRGRGMRARVAHPVELLAEAAGLGSVRG